MPYKNTFAHNAGSHIERDILDLQAYDKHSFPDGFTARDVIEGKTIVFKGVFGILVAQRIAENALAFNRIALKNLEAEHQKIAGVLIGAIYSQEELITEAGIKNGR